MILSAAMMLEWLGERHRLDALTTAARVHDAAVFEGFASGRVDPVEFGGPHGTRDVARSIVDIVAKTP
jgi:3-isopropylmalate dehydrogenase